MRKGRKETKRGRDWPKNKEPFLRSLKNEAKLWANGLRLFISFHNDKFAPTDELD